MLRKRWGWGFTQGFGGAGFSPFLTFNGTSTKVDCGSGASLDDLADAAFTAEAWIKSSSVTGASVVFDKGDQTSVGWAFFHGAAVLQGRVRCALVDANSTFSIVMADDVWHHIEMFFDDAGDRKIYLAVDGVWAASYASQTAGNGAISSDAAVDFVIGEYTDTTFNFDGGIGWTRISDNARYTPGTPFTPPARTAVPASDANTVLLLPMDEGYGAVAGNLSANDNDGAITDGVWSRG